MTIFFFFFAATVVDVVGAGVVVVVLGAAVVLFDVVATVVVVVVVGVTTVVVVVVVAKVFENILFMKYFNIFEASFLLFFFTKKQNLRLYSLIDLWYRVFDLNKLHLHATT